LWYNDATRPRIREFDGLLHAIREGKTAKMQEARPFAIVNVGVDGNFSTFSPELHGWDTSYGRMVLGNVLTDQLYAGTASESFLRARTAIDRGVDECRKVCEYFDLCGGGSPSSKFFETGRFDVSRTRFCQTQKIIVIDEVLAVLENHIKQRALADAQH
jgi:uncharacterized protein